MSDEVYLDGIPGFNWASAGNNSENFGKVSITGECFWLRECYEDDNNLWHGIIDNLLVVTSEHGLRFNQKVSFHVGMSEETKSQLNKQLEELRQIEEEIEKGELERRFSK